jgi:hypothetical protein
MEPVGTPEVTQVSNAPVPVVMFERLAVNELIVGAVGGATVTVAVEDATGPPGPVQLKL